MRLHWLVAGSLILSVAGTAAAESDDSDPARSAFYVAAAGVFAAENIDSHGGARPDDAFGYNVRAGWRFNEYGAVELEAEHLPEVDLSGAPDLEVWAASANLKWIFPLGRLEPYVVGGLGGLVAEAGSSDESDFLLRGGLGLQLHVTRNLVGVLEGTYVSGVEKLSEIAYGSVSLGLQVQF